MGFIGVPYKKPLHAKPNLYSYYFETLKEIAKEHGYNLVVHGSMNRDLDLIAIPWVNDPKPEIEMINAFVNWLNGKLDNTMTGTLPGGRTSYVINLNRGGYKRNPEGLIIDPIEFVEDPHYYIDISITPCGGVILNETQNETAIVANNQTYQTMRQYIKIFAYAVLIVLGVFSWALIFKILCSL